MNTATPEQYELLKRRINFIVDTLKDDGIEMGIIGASLLGIGGALVQKYATYPEALDEAIESLRSAVRDRKADN